MRLRTRLWFVLGALFLVPVLVATLVVAFLVPGVRTDQLERSLSTDRAVVVSQLNAQCRLLGSLVRAMALESVVATPRDAVQRAVDTRYVDYAALLDSSGAVTVEAGGLPVGTAPAGRIGSCAGSGEPAGVVAGRVPLQGAGDAVSALVATQLDASFLQEVRNRNDLDGDVMLVAGRRVLATSADPATTRAVAAGTSGRTGSVDVDGWLADVGEPTPGRPFAVVVAAPRPGADLGFTSLLLGMLAAGAVAAVLLVLLVARGLSKPLDDLTEAAERVARGDLDSRLEGGTSGEVGRLSDAFNRMTVELRRNMSALEQSREDLRDSLERIGDTLMSTHDLQGLLQVVLDTAVVTLPVRAGVVIYGSPDDLELMAGHGLADAGLSAPAVSPGQGVLGRVLATGEAVRGRLGSGPPELSPSPTEPGEGDVLAVPLRSMGAVMGVVALYDRQDGRPFDAADDDALRTLAGQASIAIDNVQLHQEAQRLSTTDALTGVWNFRYLSMSLAREIERSTRFERPLAVLMLDLDHFKQVNDVHGHARGDAVLRELAHRVQEQIREVDTFARYGGEEFVVVLPETTVEGAGQLAERICSAVRRTPFGSDGDEPLSVTVSIGGAAFPEHGSSAATLMRAADQALYSAKNSGRDRWHVPDE